MEEEEIVTEVVLDAKSENIARRIAELAAEQAARRMGVQAAEWKAGYAEALFFCATHPIPF